MSNPEAVPPGCQCWQRHGSGVRILGCSESLGRAVHGRKGSLSSGLSVPFLQTLPDLIPCCTPHLLLPSLLFLLHVLFPFLLSHSTLASVSSSRHLPLDVCICHCTLRTCGNVRASRPKFPRCARVGPRLAYPRGLPGPEPPAHHEHRALFVSGPGQWTVDFRCSQSEIQIELTASAYTDILCIWGKAAGWRFRVTYISCFLFLILVLFF